MIRPIAIGGLLAALAVPGWAEDWPQWGRDSSRNMVSPEKNLPAAFDPGKVTNMGELDLKTAKNVRWVARLGSQSYGNPTVARGKIFVGTNNDPPHLKKYAEDAGIVLCLDEATGKLLWQLTVPKLLAGNNSDYGAVGICSSPAVDGDRVYLVTNRCEVVCLDINGQPGSDEAKVIWRYDMRDELGVFPHQMASSSVLIAGDRLYVNTSNGRDWTERHIPAPNAPALICLDKKTGKLLGQENCGISKRMFLCNWSSPALATVGQRQLVIFGADDGFCYAFDAVPENGVLKEVWRCDCNPAELRMQDGKPLKYAHPKGPSGILATPVFADGKIYVAIGRNPEKGAGLGNMVCIDAATGQKVWANAEIGRSLSTAAVGGGLVFVGDFAGFLYCMDAATGKVHWSHDTQGERWGSTLLADGKVYVGDASGDLLILAASAEKKVLGKIRLEGAINSSPIVANGVLYVATDKFLYAVK